MQPRILAVAASAILLAASPAHAGPRESLAAAAFTTTTKQAALGLLNDALAQANAALAKNPGDRDAAVYRAMAVGYLAKLNKSRTGALEAKKLFDQLAAANPRDPQTQALIGGWNLDAIDSLGRMMASTVLGAKRDQGLAAIDRAAALGRNEALYPALAAMMRIRLDPGDIATARTLAEAAAKAPAPSGVDRLMQRGANQLLVPLRAGDGKAAAALARKLLPLGRVS